MVQVALIEAVRRVLEGGLWFESTRAERSEQDAAFAPRFAQPTPLLLSRLS